MIDLLAPEHPEAVYAHKARAFLNRCSETELFLPSVALGELLEVLQGPEHARMESLVRAQFHLLNVDERVSAVYGRVTRELRSTGPMIGTNNLWIGCTALAAELPLLSRRAHPFAEIPGLEALGYAH